MSTPLREQSCLYHRFDFTCPSIHPCLLPIRPRSSNSPSTRALSWVWAGGRALRGRVSTAPFPVHRFVRPPKAAAAAARELCCCYSVARSSCGRTATAVPAAEDASRRTAAPRREHACRLSVSRSVSRGPHGVLTGPQARTPWCAPGRRRGAKRPSLRRRALAACIAWGSPVG